ncbi:Uncharacterised protein g4755 [Pycnogonum litorale]
MDLIMKCSRTTCLKQGNLCLVFSSGNGAVSNVLLIQKYTAKYLHTIAYHFENLYAYHFIDKHRYFSAANIRHNFVYGVQLDQARIVNHP